jgi:hypothetical protein
MMLVLGIAPFFLFLVCLPIVIGVRLLIARLAPGLPSGPWWLDLAIFSAVPLVVALLFSGTFRSLWPRE